MRFAFGKNWKNYLSQSSDQDLESSRGHLQKLLGVSDLEGQTFLDVGSGSGLSSLAAKKMHAEVVSFDFDADSVRCTEALRDKYQQAKWPVMQGSVLDVSFMDSLGKFDIVYSWGVLHHTGNLRQAMENVLIPMQDRSILYIALYNDQGWISRYWWTVKFLYNLNPVTKFLMILIHSPYLYCFRIFYRKIIKKQPLERGMHLWFDMLDWLGGFPFEVIAPEQVIDFYQQRGLRLEKSVLCGRRHGCNEFVFQKI